MSARTSPPCAFDFFCLLTGNSIHPQKEKPGQTSQKMLALAPGSGVICNQSLFPCGTTGNTAESASGSWFPVSPWFSSFSRIWDKSNIRFPLSPYVVPHMVPEVGVEPTPSVLSGQRTTCCATLAFLFSA